MKMTPNVKAKLSETDHLLDDEYTTVRLKTTKTVIVEVEEDSEKKAKRKRPKLRGRLWRLRETLQF